MRKKYFADTGIQTLQFKSSCLGITFFDHFAHNWMLVLWGPQSCHNTNNIDTRNITQSEASYREEAQLIKLSLCATPFTVPSLFICLVVINFTYTHGSKSIRLSIRCFHCCLECFLFIFEIRSDWSRRVMAANFSKSELMGSMFAK